MAEMKTEELIARLRAGTATYCQCPGCQIPATAADRLEAILKALRLHRSTSFPDYELREERWDALRRAIEGE